MCLPRLRGGAEAGEGGRECGGKGTAHRGTGTDSVYEVVHDGEVGAGVKRLAADFCPVF